MSRAGDPGPGPPTSEGAEGGSIWSHGVVVRGHRVASGEGGDPRFPRGTIRPQLAFFRARIPDFDGYLGDAPHPATINIAFAGSRIVPGMPEFQVGPVRWTESFPPETFLISRCAIAHRAARYPAFLYIPDPATKLDHHQPPQVVEVLAGFVPGLAYGDPIALRHAAGTIAIVAA